MRIFTLLIIAFLTLSPGAGAATTGGDGKALKLDQVTSGLGPITIYVSDKAVKVLYENLKFTVVCSAPNYDVSAYSDTRKNVCTVPLSVFLRRGMTMVGQIFAGDKKFLKQGIQTHAADFHGLKCTMYQIPMADDGSSTDAMDILYNKSANNARQSCQFVTTADLPPPQIASMLAKLLHAPSSPGVPVQCSYRWAHGSTWSLKANGWSNEKVGADFFKVPRAYKIAKTFEDVQYSTSSKNEAAEAFKALDLGDLDKPRK